MTGSREMGLSTVKIMLELKFNRCEVELSGHILAVCTKPHPGHTWTKAFGINVLRHSSLGGRSTADGRLSQGRLGDGNVRTGNGNIARTKKLSKSGLIERSEPKDTPSHRTGRRKTGLLLPCTSTCDRAAKPSTARVLGVWTPLPVCFKTNERRLAHFLASTL